ncbi:MAG: hypothetical protein HY986_09545 [Candidatus Melainabacteria bacterium]|nr:hypothetical protein [Candidatus Melainabacteria bacterium]
MNTNRKSSSIEICRPKGGCLEEFLNNPGVYFELVGKDFVTGFGLGVGQRDCERKVSLLTKVIACLCGEYSEDIAALDGRQIRVKWRSALQIEAIGWIAAPATIPDAVAPFIDAEGWFYPELFGQTYDSLGVV